MNSVISGLLLGLLLVGAGCGVQESEYGRVVSERDELKKRVSDLQKDNESLKGRLASLETENKTLLEKLEKPAQESQPGQAPVQAKAGSNEGGSQPSDKYYEVQKGDNLWTIARKTGVTVQTLQSLNHLKNTKLQVGQKLILSP